MGGSECLRGVQAFPLLCDPRPVVSITAEGGAEHIEALAQRYLGAPYPWFGGRDQVRVILSITADKIHGVGVGG